MPRLLKELPLIQNWDCHACGNCCTDYVVPVSAAERARIEAQGWAAEPDFAGQPLFVRSTPWWMFWRKRWQLRQKPGHVCIFLDDKKLCRIHAKFGFETKPFACRLYPYILVPVGDQWRLSMRYACPSATANLGKPISAQLEDLSGLAKEMETWGADEATAATPATGAAAESRPDRPPPPLGRSQSLEWKELRLVAEALCALLRDRAEPIPRRMLRALALVRLLKQAKLAAFQGAKFRELLEILAGATAAEAPRDLAKLEPPSWIGRVLFRASAAVYLRKDSGTRIGTARRGRLALVGAMAKMVRGAGRLPQLQQGLPDVTFAELEEPLGPLVPEAAEALERYYFVKTSSFQFCGPICYDLPVWEGFAALALTLPTILWLARGYRALGQAAAVRKAVTVIDENYGYNPLLGQLRQRVATRILFGRGELDRLIAWHGR